MNVLSNMVHCLDVMVMSSVERSVTRVVVLQRLGGWGFASVGSWGVRCGWGHWLLNGTGDRDLFA